MLLLVVQAEVQQGFDLRPGRLIGLADQPLQGGVDVGAVGQNRRLRRPRQQPAVGPGMPLAHLFVIGIEQVAEAGVEGVVARQERLGEEGFEKPGDVRQVPFGRADVRHGLHLLVFRAQRRSQFQAARPHGGIARAPSAA